MLRVGRPEDCEYSNAVTERNRSSRFIDVALWLRGPAVEPVVERSEVRHGQTRGKSAVSPPSPIVIECSYRVFAGSAGQAEPATWSAECDFRRAWSVLSGLADASPLAPAPALCQRRHGWRCLGCETRVVATVGCGWRIRGSCAGAEVLSRACR